MSASPFLNSVLAVCTLGLSTEWQVFYRLNHYISSGNLKIKNSFKFFHFPLSLYISIYMYLVCYVMCMFCLYACVEGVCVYTVVYMWKSEDDFVVTSLHPPLQGLQ